MKKLEKMDSKYDMKIDANVSEIKSQQPYRPSPHKRKLIREAGGVGNHRNVDVGSCVPRRSGDAERQAPILH